MATLVVTPLGTHDEPQFEVVDLQIIVKEDDWVGAFDQVEVHRSRLTAGGPYDELTGERWLPARLPSTGGEPSAIVGRSVNVVGQTLQLRLKERDDVYVTFSGGDPVTLAEVANQVTQQGLGQVTAHVDAAGELVVQTTEPGTGAVLRVITSSAASILALPQEELAFGQNNRVALLRGTTSYRFTDLSGSTEYFYRTRFRNRLTNAVSEFSQPFGVGAQVGVNPVNLVCGAARLVWPNGRPMCGREVHLRHIFSGAQVDGYTVGGQDLSGRTDADGHVEFTLIRGQLYDVTVAGLDLAVRVTAPTDPTVSSFSLLDPALNTQQDYFKVRIADIPFAARRNP